MTSFRFSLNPNQADLIEWLPWSHSTFAKAVADDKPVLLSVSATWCYWCHVMDESTYSDPDVQSVLAGGFIAVRVDNDHRPDINARYNVGGWPTTAFLTPHGGLIGGATYLPPDQFLAMLLELQDAYRADKPQLYTQARDLLHRRREQARRVTAGADVDSSLVDRVSRIVAGAYDAIEGGFGSEPKFTNPAILRFAAHLYRTTGEEFYAAMLRKTLDKMAGSAIFDDVDGGFFRYSSAADWSEPQREKLLEDNIHLARLYLDASIILQPCHPELAAGHPELAAGHPELAAGHPELAAGHPELAAGHPELVEGYRGVAERTIDYVVNHLYSAGSRGFHGSQGAHSGYFRLNAEERAASALPPLDPSCYAGPGALAAATLLDASWKLGRPELGRMGLEVLERIDGMAAAGEFSHVYSEHGAGDAPALLADWAGLLAGLMQAHATTAEPRYLDRAVEVASTMVDRFFDEDGGGFFDIEAPALFENDGDGVGHMQVREKQLPENMTAVQALLRLHQVTRNDDYRQLCEATLSAFAGVFREQGEFAADFGLTVDLFKNPAVEVTVEGSPDDPACRELLAAAVRLNNPNLEIKTVAARGAPSAHVCLDTLCLPPVSTPAALAEAAAGIDNQPVSPFQDILRIFPGG